MSFVKLFAQRSEFVSLTTIKITSSSRSPHNNNTLYSSKREIKDVSLCMYHTEDWRFVRMIFVTIIISSSQKWY